MNDTDRHQQIIARLCSIKNVAPGIARSLVEMHYGNNPDPLEPDEFMRTEIVSDSELVEVIEQIQLARNQEREVAAMLSSSNFRALEQLNLSMSVQLKERLLGENLNPVLPFGFVLPSETLQAFIQDRIAPMMFHHTERISPSSPRSSLSEIRQINRSIGILSDMSKISTFGYDLWVQFSGRAVEEIASRQQLLGTMRKEFNSLPEDVKDHIERRLEYSQQNWSKSDLENAKLEIMTSAPAIRFDPSADGGELALLVDVHVALVTGEQSSSVPETKLGLKRFIDGKWRWVAVDPFEDKTSDWDEWDPWGPWDSDSQLAATSISRTLDVIGLDMASQSTDLIVRSVRAKGQFVPATWMPHAVRRGPFPNSTFLKETIAEGRLKVSGCKVRSETSSTQTSIAAILDVSSSHISMQAGDEVFEAIYPYCLEGQLREGLRAAETSKFYLTPRVSVVPSSCDPKNTDFYIEGEVHVISATSMTTGAILIAIDLQPKSETDSVIDRKPSTQYTGSIPNVVGSSDYAQVISERAIKACIQYYWKNGTIPRHRTLPNFELRVQKNGTENECILKHHLEYVSLDIIALYGPNEHEVMVIDKDTGKPINARINFPHLGLSGEAVWRSDGLFTKKDGAPYPISDAELRDLLGIKAEERVKWDVIDPFTNFNRDYWQEELKKRVLIDLVSCFCNSNAIREQIHIDHVRKYVASRGTFYLMT